MATNSSFDGSSCNWRETKTAEQCLSHLCLSDHLSDISFVFKGNGDVKLSAHKFVLSMRSDVFEAMFYGSLAEGGNTISIEDIKPKIMKEVLRFVYSDKPELNGSNVLHCLYAAKKYALTGLVIQCSSFLENNIDTSNVCLIHEQAVFYEMKPLQTICFDYILENATDVLSSQGFFQVSHATLLDLLKNDGLSIDEVDVFNAALKWSKSNCKAKQLSPDAKNLRKCLGDALFEIRFPVMPIGEFAQVVTPTGILTSEEQIILYQFNATEGLSEISKFIQRERSGKTVTIHIKKYIPKGQREYPGCCLQIQYQQQSRYNKRKNSMQRNETSLRVRSVTGPFVRRIKRITTGYGGSRINYQMKGDKITFQKPIEIGKEGTITFCQSQSESPTYWDEETILSLDSDEETDPCSAMASYHTRIEEEVNGREISIIKVPTGMETISFVKIKDN